MPLLKLSVRVLGTPKNHDHPSDLHRASNREVPARDKTPLARLPMVRREKRTKSKSEEQLGIMVSEAVRASKEPTTGGSSEQAQPPA